MGRPENREKFLSEFGNISPASIGAIQRGLITLEEEGAEKFFGEPALNILDFIQTDNKGKGVINVLTADKLMMSPRTYSTFLLYFNLRGFVKKLMRRIAKKRCASYHYLTKILILLF